MIWVIANLHNDNGLLPFFLRYYRSKGVDRFGFITRFDSPLFTASDVQAKYLDEPYKNGHRDNELLNNFRATHLEKEDSYIPADLDEFYWNPGLQNFHELIGNWDYVPAVFLDRVSADGIITPIDQSVSLDSQYPLGGRVIKKLCGGCDSKVALANAYIESNSGHHFVKSGIAAPFTVQCHHFRFCGSDFWERMAKREVWQLDSTKTEFPPFREHYIKFGRINVVDPLFEFKEAPKIGV